MPPKLQAMLDDLAMFPDRADRIEALIALSREYVHPSAGEVPRTEEARVPGCESEVFMGLHDGRFRFGVDNPQGVSAMALARLLEEGLDSTPTRELPDDLVYEVFGRELSMGKSLGLTNMVRMVRDAARAS